MTTLAQQRKVSSLLKKIAKKIEQLIKADPEVFDLQWGTTGASLFLYEYGKFTKKALLVDRARNLTLESLAKQQNHNKNTSLYSGPLGSYWCARYQKIPSGSLKPYEGIKDELISRMRELMSYEGFFELAHGATGWGLFSEIINEENLKKDIIAYLKKTQKMSKNQLWTLPPMYDRGGNVAWGIAHGVLGPLIWMNEKQNGKFIYKYLKPTLDKPNVGIENVPPKKGVKPQSAWCYGDAGVGYALSLLGVRHQQAQILDIGTEVFHRGSQGLTLYRSVKGFDLCHGLGGMLLLTRLHYKMTKNPKSRELSEFWLNKILDDSEGIDGMTSLGLMNGLGGLGLALLEMIKKSDSKWPRVLLLS